MDLKQALAAFPPRSPFRGILRKLLDEDEEVREAARRRLDAFDDGPDPTATTWRFSEPEARALLSAAVSLPFPPPERDWRDAVHDLIFLLVRSPHPSLVRIAREGYPRLSPRAQCAVLSLLGACGSREAAEAFIACVREHGWPPVYSRVFWELPKLLDHAEVLFPDLIALAGPNLTGVTNVFLAGLAGKKLDLSSGKCDFEAVAPLAAKQLKKALKAAARHQRDQGVAWRFTEKYWDVRRAAGCWLDLAGYLRSTALSPLLREALHLRDPLLQAYAAASVLRRGGKVARSVLNRVAACHETRGLLFGLLEGLGRLDFFPPRYRTWDAFAAANIVDWLSHPSELGREPDALEKMAVVTSKKPGGDVALYVWRFRGDDGEWYAATSGPYVRKGEPRPVHGESTFSRFERWDSATAEEHAEAVLETLADWRRAHG